MTKLGPRKIKKYSIISKQTEVEAGSGSLPTEKIPSIAISFSSNKISSNKISSNLRSGSIPILNYINNDRVFIDLKAIPDDQINELISTMKECL